jgi:hypothetical protein
MIFCLFPVAASQKTTESVDPIPATVVPSGERARASMKAPYVNR